MIAIPSDETSQPNGIPYLTLFFTCEDRERDTLLGIRGGLFESQFRSEKT